MAVFFVYKIARRDFFCWIRVEGVFGVLLSIVYRFFSKVIVDFTGCLLMRHPYECGGAAFTISMLWAQVMPFLALYFSELDAMKNTITIFLICSFVSWLLLDIAFFCTIDLTYLSTFVGVNTASQYTQELFLTSAEDSAKFRSAFKKRASYTLPIHEEVKRWVTDNIGRWQMEKEDWFNIQMIPDDMLPLSVFIAEGGVKRRRSSLKEVLGLGNDELKL